MQLIRSRLLVLMGLLLGACSAGAQVYGQAQKTVDNATLIAKVSIPGITSDGQRISGSNVNVSCTSKAQANGASVSDPVVEVRLKRAVLTIGGQSVYNDVFNVAFNEPEPASEASSLVAPAPQVQEPVLYPDVRDPRDVIFASTKFEHQAEVEVSLTLTYVVKRSSGSTDEHELDPAVVTPAVYNHLLLWRTEVNDLGLPLIAQYDQWIEDSRLVAVEWYEGANYEVTYISEATKAQLLASMAIMTSVFGLTHGSPTSVSDSLGVTSTHNLTWLNIEGGLSDRYTAATMPQVSHLFFYACLTVPGQSPDLFWLTRVPRATTGEIVNAGSLGFTKNYIFTWHEQHHIDALFNHLNLGYTMSDAVLWANEESGIPVDANSSEGPDPEYAPAQWLGDAFATFNQVYLPPDVRNALSAPYAYANWWWASPHVP